MSTEDLGKFVARRAHYGAVRRVWNDAMCGWDIVLVLDGHYFDEDSATEMEQYHQGLYIEAAERSGVCPQDPGHTYRYERVSKDTRNR